MQAYENGSPMGSEFVVSTDDTPEATQDMFDAGADEVRIRRLPARGITKAPLDKKKARRKTKHARQARKRNR